jgi:hypothetical protein
MECPCFHFEKDWFDICTCGHTLDEHDEKFNCRASEMEMNDAPGEESRTGPPPAVGTDPPA